MCRKPFCESARKLLLLGYLGEVELFTSSSQVTDVFYIISRGGKKRYIKQARNAIKAVRGAVGIVQVGEAEVDAALDSSWQDFEDACVYQAARSIRADAIITRNQTDFEESSIKVFSCEEFFDWLEDEEGVVYEEVDL